MAHKPSASSTKVRSIPFHPGRARPLPSPTTPKMAARVSQPADSKMAACPASPAPRFPLEAGGRARQKPGDAAAPAPWLGAATMRLLPWWPLLVGALWPATHCLLEESDGSLSEQQRHTETDLPLSADTVHFSNEEHELGQTEQYDTGETAYTTLGNEVNGDHLLSVIPGEAKDGHISDFNTGSCDAGVEGSECNIRESLFSLFRSEANVPDKGEEYNLFLEAVPTSPPPKEDSNSTESVKTPKVNCEERNVTGLESFTLQILNVSQDLMEFLNPNSSDCTLVLFYTPWCRFSASLAPHFNSLPRAFPSLHFLALDASQHSSLSTRFGTVAVPNILLFQGAKPMARFNHTDRTLETLKAFIFNQTGIEAKNDVVVTEDDQIGPLPSTLVKSVDWLLVFSLFFLVSFIMYATVRTESIRWLIPGQEHEHPE